MMCYLLGNVEGKSILEPSVGHGAFLSGLLGNPSRIDVVDIDDQTLRFTQSRYSNLQIRAFHQDFIDLFVEGLMTSSHPVRSTLYDLVISNPPYGLYFDLSYRKKIKNAFPGFYARESYGLFFAFAVSQLKPGAKYVFLVPDTFLSSVNHRPLRNFMCSEAALTHIIRFPSRLFETVNFGYGNLCIIAGEKRALTMSDTVQWLSVFDKEEELSLDSLTNAKPCSGSALINNSELGWSSSIFDGSEEVYINWPTLGEIAECRTGIYTGDNKSFIGYDAARITRRLNGHPISWSKQVYDGVLTTEQRESGINGEQKYVPLIRGGHREPFEQTASAVDWGRKAIHFYKTNKKARFQNSRFYYREGLSVPMVTTKRISAALMNNAVFDQGVVGIFPHVVAEIPALLLYLNSSLASEKMKKIVNGSANNSANYLKRLPVPYFYDADIQKAASIVEAARHQGSLALSICNEFVEGVTCQTTTLGTRSDQLAGSSNTHRGYWIDQPAS